MILTLTYDNGDVSRFDLIVPGSVKGVEPPYWARRRGLRTAIEFRHYAYNKPAQHLGVILVEMEEEVTME